MNTKINNKIKQHIPNHDLIIQFIHMLITLEYPENERRKDIPKLIK